jgi:hypothetical protein
MERKLLVETAQGYYEAALGKNTDGEVYSTAEKLLFMENALNHTENALQYERERNERFLTVWKSCFGSDQLTAIDDFLEKHRTEIQREQAEKEIYKSHFKYFIERVERELEQDGWCRLTIKKEDLQEFKKLVTTPADIKQIERTGVLEQVLEYLKEDICIGCSIECSSFNTCQMLSIIRAIEQALL